MSTANLIAICITFLLPIFLIVMNKKKVQGKMLCAIARKDKSVKFELCELRSSFVIWKDRAYDVYPDFVRIVKYPMGWPSILQESVPSSLYDEDDALPKDWVTLSTPKEGSLSLRSALDENWVKKLVTETSAQSGGAGFNWRKILPIALIGLGGLGLILLLSSKGCSALPVSKPAADIIDLLKVVI